MTSVQVADAAASKRPPPSTRGSPGDSRNIQVHSATSYLLKKAASKAATGIPHVAKMVWGIVYAFACDESVVGLIEEIGEAADAVISAAFSPHFRSTLGAFLSSDDLGGDCLSRGARRRERSGSEATRATTTMSESSSYEQEMTTGDEGLAFGGFGEDDADEDDERLDEVITQADVSRMAREASRRLEAESLPKLPAVICREKDPPSCPSPSPDEENIDDFLLRNAQIIEDYFDGTSSGPSPCPSGDELDDGIPSDFSWMMVPEDPAEGEITRMSGGALEMLAEDVPGSISIRKSIR